MTRASLIHVIIAGAVCASVVVAASGFPERPHPWIVLVFRMPGGPLKQIAFDNPDLFNEEECREILPHALERLIRAAHHSDPGLRRGVIIGARCNMSAGAMRPNTAQVNVMAAVKNSSSRQRKAGTLPSKSRK
jgi:hypothetical protein